jgi:hypothetical protein
MTVISLSEARELRPSQVIAEALVDRQAPKQIEARARELGYSNCLTTAVVHACCGHNEQTKSPIQLQTIPTEHHASN